MGRSAQNGPVRCLIAATGCRWDRVDRRLTPSRRLLWLAGFGALVLGACAAPEEPAPVGAADLIEAHAGDGLDPDVASCAISILIDDVDPDALWPDASRSPVDELLFEETVAACSDANELLASEDAEPDGLAFSIEPQIYGDDPVLDQLWDSCELGVGEACDALWREAPVGSVYEKFGVTCGERFEVLDCSEELTGLPEAAESPGETSGG